MAALLNAIACYFVTPAHICGVLRVAKYYNIALGCLWAPSALLLLNTALRPVSFSVKISIGGFLFNRMNEKR